MSDNADRFVNFCHGASLRIAGSFFRRKDIHRFSWLSNDETTRKEIGHISSTGGGKQSQTVECTES